MRITRNQRYIYISKVFLFLESIVYTYIGFNYIVVGSGSIALLDILVLVIGLDINPNLVRRCIGG